MGEVPVVFGAISLGEAFGAVSSAIHKVEPLGGAFDKVTGAVSFAINWVKPSSGTLDTVYSATHRVKPLGDAFDKVSSVIDNIKHCDKWSEELKNDRNFQNVDSVIKDIEKHDDDFAKDFRIYLNENHRDFLRPYFIEDHLHKFQSFPNQYTDNRPSANVDTQYAKDLSKVLQSFILDRFKSSFDNGNSLSPPFIDTPSPNVTILKPTRHSMAIQNDTIDSSSEIKEVNQKRIFIQNVGQDLKGDESCVYAKAGAFINNVLQKEVNIVRNEDMNCLFINDCRLNNASIKIEFKGSEIELSLVSRDTKKIESEAPNVQDILNSITINVCDQHCKEGKIYKDIYTRIEPITMEASEAENRIRLIKEEAVSLEQKDENRCL